MEKRDYNIPLLKIGFYGTGLCEVSEESKQELRELIQPIRDLVLPLVEINPVHVTCRYLGYYDEISASDLKKARAKAKAIFHELLPFTVEGNRLFTSWEKHPEHYRKLLMLDVSDPKLLTLHNKLLSVTPDLPVFHGVEAGNFRPHFTLAQVKPELASAIPAEVNDFVNNFRSKVRVTFNNAYIWGPEGLEKL